MSSQPFEGFASIRTLCITLFCFPALRLLCRFCCPLLELGAVTVTKVKAKKSILKVSYEIGTR
jgi:hypothetical protein